MIISNFFIYADDAEISTLDSPSTFFTASAGKTGTFSNLLKGGNVDIINLAFIGVGLVFFFNLIMAGWDYLLSSGDPKKAAVASARLTNGLTGLLMAFTAFLVVRIVTTILSIDTFF